MKAWYIIGIVMALIPLFFRNRHRVGITQAKGTAGLAADKLSTERRLLWLLLLGAIGVLVYAWAATPPL